MVATMGNAMKPLSTTRLSRAALAALGILTLAGCVNLAPKAPEQLFRLTAEESLKAGATAGGQLTDAIFVLDPETDRSLDVLRLPVRVDDSRVAYLQRAAWIEKPARQFRSLLAETLRARSGRLVVEGGDFEATGKTRLGGRLLQMGYDAPTGAVVVRYDAVMSTGEGGREVASRRFEARVDGIEPKPKFVGPALNKAANDVARQVADWVKG